MKRINRLTSLASITERMLEPRQRSPLRKAVLERFPAELFGPAIAAQVDGSRREGNVLYLFVRDPLWRAALRKQRRRLLERAHRFDPTLKEIRIGE